MRRTLLLSGMALLSFGCRTLSSSDAGSDVKIANGERVYDTSDAVTKSTVALLLGGETQFCSGTIADAGLVVSAAHCFSGMEDAMRQAGVKVGFGVGPVFDRVLPVVKVHYHAEYAMKELSEQLEARFKDAHPDEYHELEIIQQREENGQLTEQLRARRTEIANMMLQEFGDILIRPEIAMHDIAVLQYSGDAPSWADDVDMIATSESLPVGTPLIAAGFGLTSEGGGGSNGSLYKTRMRVGSVNVEGQEFLTRPGQGTDTCKGDSGGPLYIERDGVLQLAGITSRARAATPCENSPGAVYTDVRHHNNWLYCQALAMTGSAGDDCASERATVLELPEIGGGGGGGGGGNSEGCLNDAEQLEVLLLGLSVDQGVELTSTERARLEVLAARLQQYGTCN